MGFFPVQSRLRVNVALLALTGLGVAFLVQRNLVPRAPLSCGLGLLLEELAPGAPATEPTSPATARETARLTAALLARDDAFYRLLQEHRAVLGAGQLDLDPAPTLVPATVTVPRDLSDLRRAVLINRGRRDGLREGLAVTALGFLVGRTTRVGERQSWVLLVTDTAFRCPVVVGGKPGVIRSPEGWEVGRPRGVYVGLSGLGGGGEVLNLQVTGRDESARAIARDDIVYTAGSEQLWAGVPLGRITAVNGRRSGLFLDVSVEPALRLDRLEHVVVLVPPESPGLTEGAR